MTRSRCRSSWNVRRHALEHAAALDEHVLVGVDQDVADRRVAQQRLERPEAEHLVDAARRTASSRSPRLSGVPSSASSSPTQRPDLALGARAVGLRQRLEVQPVEQLPVDVRLQLDVLRRAAPAGASPAGRAPAGRTAAWRQRCCDVLMGGYQMRRDAARGPSRPFFAARPRRRLAAAGSIMRRVKWSNCAAISELPASASGTPELSAVDTVL